MSQKLPPEVEASLEASVEKMAGAIIAAPLPPVTRIPVYCNVCEHPIERRGSEWQCSENCRCMMIGCVPKVWRDED